MLARTVPSDVPISPSPQRLSSRPLKTAMIQSHAHSHSCAAAIFSGCRVYIPTKVSSSSRAPVQLAARSTSTSAGFTTAQPSTESMAQNSPAVMPMHRSPPTRLPLSRPTFSENARRLQRSSSRK